MSAHMSAIGEIVLQNYYQNALVIVRKFFWRDAALMHPRLAGKVEQARERGRMDFISTLALPFGGVTRKARRNAVPVDSNDSGVFG